MVSKRVKTSPARFLEPMGPRETRYDENRKPLWRGRYACCDREDSCANAIGMPDGENSARDNPAPPPVSALPELIFRSFSSNGPSSSSLWAARGSAPGQRGSDQSARGSGWQISNLNRISPVRPRVGRASCSFLSFFFPFGVPECWSPARFRESLSQKFKNRQAKSVPGEPGPINPPVLPVAGGWRIRPPRVGSPGLDPW